MTSRVGSVLFGAVLLLGCASGPKHRIDEGLLADVPVGEKQGMLAAKSEIDAATEEKRKASADLQAVERDVSVAQSEYGQAKLEVDKVEADVKLAEQSKDLNWVNASKAQLKLAKLGRDVADAKVDWLKKRRKGHQAVLEVAEAHQAAAAARYEQEKARLAQQKGKMPSKDFSVSTYDQQLANSQRKYDEAKVDASKAQVATSEMEQKYNNLLLQYQQARGTPAPPDQALPQPQPLPGAAPAPQQGQPGQPAQPQPGQAGQPGAPR